jgi:glucose-1-phosphate thymidylyltransferase
MKTNIKGIILAGGTGSRLAPLNKICNKHQLPIGLKPMLQWNVEKMVNAGVQHITIVTGREHMGSIVNYFGSGHLFNCEFTYRVQDEAGGIAEAIYVSKPTVGENDKLLVILGDNIFEDKLLNFVNEFKDSNNALIATYEHPEPNRFGVVGDDGVIYEKPAIHISNNIVTGIYGYPNAQELFDNIKTLDRSPRGEYEVTDLNNIYIKKNRMSFYPLSGKWTDAGTHSSYLEAQKLKL